MNELTMETFERRLDRVERENRRLKVAGVVVLTVIAAVLLMGQATGSKVAKVVEAEKFVRKDGNGKVRVVLGPTSWLFKGVPGVTFYDGNGNSQGGLLAIDKGVFLLLRGKEGMIGAMASNEADDPGETSVGLGLTDKSEKDRVSLTVWPDGGLSLRLADRDEKTRAELAVQADGNPRLALYDKAGKVIWSAP